MSTLNTGKDRGESSKCNLGWLWFRPELLGLALQCHHHVNGNAGIDASCRRDMTPGAFDVSVGYKSSGKVEMKLCVRRIQLERPQVYPDRIPGPSGNQIDISETLHDSG